MPILIAILAVLGLGAAVLHGADSAEAEPDWKQECRGLVQRGVYAWPPPRELPPRPHAPNRCSDELDIFAAAELDCPDRILELVSRGVEANAQQERGETVLHVAARHSSVEAVRALLQSGADPNGPGLAATPLCLAVRSPKIVSMLLAAGAESDVPGCRAAARAARYGDVDTLSMILAHGEVNLEQPDQGGLTAFHRSMQGATSLEMPRLLLEHGAFVDGGNYEGETALFSYNSGARGCFLLLNGANPNHRSNDGSTPLMFAARWGHVEAIQLLVAAGADINARDMEGNSALDLALTTTRIRPSESLSAAILLLELGTDCDEVKVFRGHLYDPARVRKSTRLLNAVKKAGCEVASQ